MDRLSGPSSRTLAGKRRWIGWLAGFVASALVVTLAVVASGFDSRETPRDDPSVWVERVTGQYARVNTETAEIDTVRAAESPSAVVQTADLGVLLTQGYGRAWAIDPTSPIDVQDEAGGDERAAPGVSATGAGLPGEAASAEGVAVDVAASAEAGGALRTPEGTRQVSAEGNFVLFFTQNGEAFISEVAPKGDGGAAELSAPLQLDPLVDERDAEDAESERFLANAATLDESGVVALYSQSEQAIRWFEAATNTWRGEGDRVPAEVPAEGVQLAIVRGAWVLFDAASGRLWQQGRDAPTRLEVVGAARLQASSAEGSEVLVADEAGLWQVGRDGVAERTIEADGATAQPRYIAGDAVAAWVGSSSARMWTKSGGDVELKLDETVEDLSNPEPEIRSNGRRALITERRSGMMWTVPDGTLIPVEQWSLVDPPKQETGTVVTQDVTEQVPPVASDDEFGVRAGEPALLPVLLNDYDPNRKDVLTVVPEGLGEGLESEFGAVVALSDGQAVTVQPSAAAQGSATFRYRVTDGINVSEPATVTLTVAEESVNTAPQWCAVEGCQRSWPSPELAPGGTLIMPILEGWVDPEGDPMMLAGAEVANSEDPLRALVTADGKLAVRHTDPNAPAGDAAVTLRVVDARGVETERELRVRIRVGAAMEFASSATVTRVGEATLLRPLERVTGGSGSFQLVDALVQQGALSVNANQGAGTVEVQAAAAGGALVSVTVRDTVTGVETSGTIRVTAVESRGAFGVPPLRAFVRPFADSTVDVLASIPGANSRALTVQSAAVKDGQLRADIIEHSRVRVSGSTADGQPGRIGSVDVVITEGETSAQGRLTVFQVADSGAGAIAVTDAATVRAGSVVDIPVLENDVAPPGERLVLHPEVGAPGAPGELAFASGVNVRYLAPMAPGDYTLSYTTYGASNPERSDAGQVRVTVLPTGANRDPLASTVTVRVAPGERVSAAVPLSGVDPDGDRLRLVSVESPDDAQLTASVPSRSNSLQVEASPSAQRGTRIGAYTVRDSFGGEARGTLRIIVTDPDPRGGAPVVYSDYMRIVLGSPDAAVLRPLENDLDPSGGSLQIVSVEPNVPGGEDSPLSRDLAARLDLSEIEQGVVRVRGGDTLGTVSYRYTVRSPKSTSTADGLIVVQVSERIGQQAPVVADTVLSVRDRADFEQSGVDVVTDRVRWAAGDAASLTLSLWGDAADRYRVKGSKIIGSYRAEGDLVPFRLSGTDMTGAEALTFGFLIVPPLDELRLTLQPSAQPISVNEGKSVDIGVADLLDLGLGDRVELEQTAFQTQRQQATCVATGDTTIRYSAGRDAPWSDSCTIRVRLTEQTTYTSLAIPISIVPDKPVVQLNPLTRTIAPGASQAIDLVDMVQWQGGRSGDTSALRWQVTGGSAAFEIATSGSKVRVQARADAVPGSQEVLTVSVSGAGDGRSLLTLRVGEAPVDAPRGGAVSLQCTVGSSCSTALVGLSGEYDPFAGKSGGGLRLVAIDSAGCQAGTMQTVGDSVNVSWADPRGPGSRCTATFTVRDAQNRLGTGSIEFDAQGVPRAPSSIEATGATASSVTLTVSLNSQTAHPEVTGVEILDEGGTPVTTCTPTGNVAVCTVNDVPVGKENGRSYRARAVNPVGPSDPTANASAATWAYLAPPAPIVAVEAVKNSSNTSQSAGQARLEVSGSDRARRFLLSIDGGERIEVGRSSTHSVAPGAHRFVVIPEDRDVPPGYSGTAEGAAGTAEVIVGAAPILTGVELRATGETSAELAFSSDPNYAAPRTLEFRYGISAPNESSASCTSRSPIFTSLTELRSYVGVICATSEFGTTTVTSAPIWLGGAPAAVVVNSGYRIGGAPAELGTVREYTTVTTQPSVSGLVRGAWLRYSLSTGGVADNALAAVPVGAAVQVQQCITGAGTEHCSQPVAVPAAGPPPTAMTWSGACVVSGGDLASVFTVSGRAVTDASFSESGQDIRVDWAGGEFSATQFGGAICAATPPVPVDPGGGG